MQTRNYALVAGDGDGALFHLVAILTGSKNALKGVGFFVGAALLAAIGYDAALWSMAAMLTIVLGVVAVTLNEDIGRSTKKTPLRSILSKSEAINRLSFARFFLFASRDIWFVVALPIFLHDELGWTLYGVGGFLAAWVIGYGMIQSVAPRFLRGSDEITAARQWAFALAIVSALIAAAVGLRVGGDVGTSVTIVGGLLVFGAVFALNSSLHSYLILAYSDDDDVSMDVGFYYSANATGRLVVTLLSGLLYLWGGLTVALFGAAVFVAITWLLTLRLPALPTSRSELVGSSP